MTKFSKEGWEKITEFNKKAADPNVPEVKYTLAGDSERARELGKLTKGVPKSAEHRRNLSLSHKLSYMRKKILEGDVPKDSHIQAMLDTIKSGPTIAASYYEIVVDLLERLEELDDPRDRISAQIQVAKLHEPIMRMIHQSNENIVKKVPLEQLNAMMKERQEQRKNG